MKKNVKLVVWFYIAVAAVTMLYQARVRLAQCNGVGPCSVSIAKGAVWSGAWPAYWTFFTYDRMTVKPAPVPTVDAEWYLSQYPDVRAAIENGQFKSALDHYLNNGIREKRIPSRPKVDEEFYLKSNPDVAEAVRQGRFKSGFEHYVLYGYFEDRKPAP